MRGSEMGFILVDASLNPLAANAEAVRILSFPANPSKHNGVDSFLRDKLRSHLAASNWNGREEMFVAEIISGRRNYVCRVFRLDPQSTETRASMVVLLERDAQPSVDMSRVAEEYDLTPRESEAVGYLLLGLTSKEIASRMNVSASTVNAFLHLVMLKTGAISRSGIVRRILCPKF